MNVISDDRVLDTRDMAEEIEQAKQARTFSDVLGEWTETCIAAHRKTDDLASMQLIADLGQLGQRLILEANTLGMREITKFAVGEMRR